MLTADQIEYWDEEYEEWMKGDIETYQDFVESMIITTGNTRLAENTLGLVGEAGEVAEKVKKYYRDGAIDEEAVSKELGDVLFYVVALAGYFNLNARDIMSANIEKLVDRLERNKLQGSGDNR